MTRSFLRTCRRKSAVSLLHLVIPLLLILLSFVLVVRQGWYPRTTTLEHATIHHSIHNNGTQHNSLDEHVEDLERSTYIYRHRRLDEVVVVEVGTVSESDQLSVDVTFEEILKTVVFLLATFLAANLCKFISLPSFVGEIIAGVILGPPVLDFCPYPEAMVLIGSFGLIGLVLSGGIDLDIAQLRETGTRSVMIAVSGTVLALGSGIGVSYLDSADSIQSAFSIGAAFAPSSWGVASQVLSKGEVLNTPIGQTILASSVADDILGLVLLSLLEVFVMENPSTFDYIKPFLASFGYLIVLGFVGITIIPRVLSKYILPKFPEQNRDGVAIGLMFILMTVYLPLMNYSGASYLTGAFLAGVSFSQLHHVHATFAKSSHEIMVWLLRIFFAATIGFQVPVSYFNETHVIQKGCLFLVPVFSKFLLGFLTPWSKRDLPDDFPYNPYWRDFLITSFSMMCRGEFNFVVAAVALRAKLLTPEQYAGIVFAVLVSCVVCPFVLARIIGYYNKKSHEYLDQSHPIKRIGNTGDGYRPLYLAIQARTPVNWGFHEKLEKTLESAGLIVIDHRSWHTLGYEDGVDITEIFCQDKQVQVKIPGYFSNETDMVSRPSVRRSVLGEKADSEEKVTALPDDSERSDTGTFSVSSDVEALIDERKAEIHGLISNMLGSNLDPNEYAIQVSEWETFSFQKDPEQPNAGDQGENRGYCFFAKTPTQKSGVDFPDDVGFLDNEVGFPDNGHDSIEVTPAKPIAKPTHHKGGSSLSLTRKVLNRAVSNASAVESIGDLWDTDPECHTVARAGYYQAPQGRDGSLKVTVEEGCFDYITARPRDESLKSVPRSRADSGASLEFSDVELSLPPEQQQQQEETLDTPPPATQVRRRNLHQRSQTLGTSPPVEQTGHSNRHQRNNTMEVSPPVEQTGRRNQHHRNHTMDVGMLGSFEIETHAIEERLHGYVR